ncbi:BCS1 N terminal-domain-containing protein [Aspergillus coremiiformis]|uniref:BCS1 N terminal-domain-containing protein n=1 Tax=Aspergillus coremiiformis TaxID=138285 RepID=A0A5N6Z520_9EURO|nr:BCS1 N terminal-domain-containing protein [Aspergillus coremiiformis]
MESSSSVGKLFYVSYIAVGSYFVKSLLDQVWGIPLKFFYSTVEVQSHDEAYNYLLFWLVKQRFGENKNRLIASTTLSAGFDPWNNVESDDGGIDEMLDVEGVSSTEWKVSLANTRRLLWSPSDGTHYFTYNGRYLAVTRMIEERSALYTRMGKLRISCLGWDASILKRLMLEARIEYSQKEKGKTVIYRGAKRAYDEKFYWARSTSRPARPLSTVILDPEEKTAFIRDVQYYLHPRTAEWYSDHGIPYRRGYLFHGPPGTGKSSLAFAAGGFLGLNVYILDLNGHQMTEDVLAQLFQDLPRRALVLLEDIDTNEVTNRRTKQAKQKGNGDEKVSLSGLLNAIDGVAAQEGRVLIMTTNHHDNLDPALVRAGRVDYQIEFKLANRTLMKEMFENLFRDGPPRIESPAEDREISSPTEQAPLLPVADDAGSLPARSTTADGDLERWATTFADQIPELTFSPAEIQGYLLCHKSSPVEAITQIKSWMAQTLAEKKKTQDAGNESKKVGKDSNVANNPATKDKNGKRTKAKACNESEADDEKEQSFTSDSESSETSSETSGGLRLTARDIAQRC